jgi:hypothetical protein
MKKFYISIAVAASVALWGCKGEHNHAHENETTDTHSHAEVHEHEHSHEHSYYNCGKCELGNTARKAIEPLLDAEKHSRHLLDNIWV